MFNKVDILTFCKTDVFVNFESHVHVVVFSFRSIVNALTAAARIFNPIATKKMDHI